MRRLAVVLPVIALVIVPAIVFASEHGSTRQISVDQLAAALRRDGFTPLQVLHGAKGLNYTNADERRVLGPERLQGAAGLFGQTERVEIFVFDSGAHAGEGYTLARREGVFRQSQAAGFVHDNLLVIYAHRGSGGRLAALRRTIEGL
jgi:hypothetical protein